MERAQTPAPATRKRKRSTATTTDHVPPPQHVLDATPPPTLDGADAAARCLAPVSKGRSDEHVRPQTLSRATADAPSAQPTRARRRRGRGRGLGSRDIRAAEPFSHITPAERSEVEAVRNESAETDGFAASAVPAAPAAAPAAAPTVADGSEPSTTSEDCSGFLLAGP